MNAEKIALFMQLAGQRVEEKLHGGDPQKRALGAMLLLSEVLEYVVHGLGVTPECNGVAITAPNLLTYRPTATPDHKEMVDGLADVAYTMFWNACAFGIPLQRAFELVCENNLEKFVRLAGWSSGERLLEPHEWHCERSISWPPEVTSVQVIAIGEEHFAVGKDTHGKVRKPSTYRPVNLAPLVAHAAGETPS